MKWKSGRVRYWLCHYHSLKNYELSSPTDEQIGIGARVSIVHTRGNVFIPRWVYDVENVCIFDEALYKLKPYEITLLREAYMNNGEDISTVAKVRISIDPKAIRELALTWRKREDEIWDTMEKAIHKLVKELNEIEGD